jgi:hypothetical protein
MITIVLAFILIIHPAYSQNHVGAEESSLMKACTRHDLPSCETLGAYYIKKENWDKAIIVGKALCDKDLPLGCTYAGIALMAKGESKDGNKFLTKACDKFEPYACRSLGRLMKKVGEANLSHLYFRRACHYGLKEICGDLKKGKTIFSKAGLDFVKKTQEDCSDTQASTCTDKLATLASCSRPLTKEDCVLLPGHLSILFRAKLMQSEAKFSLLSLVASQKGLRNDPKVKSYSYDLSSVLKDYKPLNNYNYVFGFMKACSGKDTAISLELFPESYQNLSSRVSVNIRNYFLKGKAGDCFTLTGGFEAFAVANLDPLNQARMDVWKIDQNGNLIHVLDGLPIP